MSKKGKEIAYSEKGPEFVTCPECGSEQGDMGRNVTCDNCGFGPMPSTSYILGVSYSLIASPDRKSEMQGLMMKQTPEGGSNIRYEKLKRKPLTKDEKAKRKSKMKPTLKK